MSISVFGWTHTCKAACKHGTNQSGRLIFGTHSKKIAHSPTNRLGCASTHLRLHMFLDSRARVLNCSAAMGVILSVLKLSLVHEAKGGKTGRTKDPGANGVKCFPKIDMLQKASPVRMWFGAKRLSNVNLKCAKCRASTPSRPVAYGKFNSSDGPGKKVNQIQHIAMHRSTPNTCTWLVAWRQACMHHEHWTAIACSMCMSNCAGWPQGLLSARVQIRSRVDFPCLLVQVPR